MQPIHERLELGVALARPRPRNLGMVKETEPIEPESKS